MGILSSTLWGIQRKYILRSLINTAKKQREEIYFCDCLRLTDWHCLQTDKSRPGEFWKAVRKIYIKIVALFFHVCLAWQCSETDIWYSPNVDEKPHSVM